MATSAPFRPPDRRFYRFFGLVFVLLVLIQRLVLQDFPNSADEYAYLWQAQTFASGQITAASPKPAESFWFVHLGDVDGRRFGRFPPGWPLILSLGVRLGLPGLLNPLLGTLALLAIFEVGRRWVGERPAQLGVLLTGLSPFFLLGSASYHCHPACLLAISSTALLIATLPNDRPQPWKLLLAGVATGLAVLIRPFTALLLCGPLLVYALTRLEGRRPKAIGALFLVLGGLPMALLFYFINQATTGNGLLLATQLLDPEEGLGFGVHGHTLQQGLQTTLLWWIEGLAYTFFLSPLLLFPARRRAGPHESLLWILLLAPVIGYLFYWNPGGNRYGPRFYFEALLPFTLLTGVGLARVLDRGRYRGLLQAAALMALVVLGKHCQTIHAQVWARTQLEREVKTAGLDHAVVLLLSGSGDMPWVDLTRNPPQFEEAPVLYGRGRGEADREVAEAFPERRLYYYREEEVGSAKGKGRLWPVDLLHVEPAVPMPDR